MEGIQIAPDVVEKESFLDLYLRSNEYNFWKAASKICRYWHERKRIFGADRCYRPLTLTGNGALTKEDVRVLSAGFPSILPRLSSGETVVLMDRRRWATVDANVPAKRRHRCLFYIAKKCCEQVIADNSPDGVYVLLVNLLLPRFQKVDEGSVSTAYDFLSQAFPGKPRVHLVCKPPKAAQQWYVVQNLISRYVKLVERGCDFGHIELHLETEDGEIQRSLSEHNFTEGGIPFFAGGNWDYKSASLWTRKQAMIEREQEQLDTVDKLRASAQRNPSDPTERKRVLNAINSRKKRERRRREQENLHHEHEQLARENEKLKQDRSRLQSLLDTVKEMEVFLIGGDVGRANAIAIQSPFWNPRQLLEVPRVASSIFETSNEVALHNGGQSISLNHFQPTSSSADDAERKRIYASFFTQNIRANDSSVPDSKGLKDRNQSGSHINDDDLAAMEPTPFLE